jgi:hypothetical protein
MKNKTSLFLAALVCVGSLTGCAKFGGIFNPTEATEEVTESVTSIVNEATGIATLSTNYTTNVVYTVSSGWGKAIAGVKSANSALNPTPTAPFINLGLGALSAALAVFARFKTKKAAAADGMVGTLIAGVELAGDKATKDAVKKIAQNFNQARELHARVKNQTDSNA